MRYLLIAILFVNLSQKSFGQIITTFAGNGVGGYSGDGGLATNAELVVSYGISVDVVGNVYIADSYYNCIRIVNTSGIITTIAGNGTQGYSGDGGPATAAELNKPNGVAIDASGNLYIADQYNQRIRMVNPAGTIITIAGNGTQGYSGDGGPATAAKLSFPAGLCIDALGNLYIADENNNRIRMVNTAGTISTIAGNGTGGDGGPAVAATLSSPTDVKVDVSGNLYIAAGNVIRKVNPAGTISTIAGNGIIGYSGDGGQATAAELNFPFGITCDTIGNVYIADDSNQRIRKVNTTTGIISTFAGTGTPGYSGNGGLATNAEINSPTGAAMDASGNLYIADGGNHVIRKVTADSTLPAYSIKYATITPAAGAASSYLAGGNSTYLGGSIINKGSSTITTFTAVYTDGTNTYTTVLTGLSIASSDSASFSFTTPYNVTLGSHPITSWVTLSGATPASDDTLHTVLVGMAYMPTHRVVLEEATGTWCEWCPRGAVYMDSIAAVHPTSVSLIAIHNNDHMEVPVYNNGFNSPSNSFNSPGGIAFPRIAFDRKESFDPLFIFSGPGYPYHIADFGFADLTLATTVIGNNLVASATVKPAINLSGTYQLALVITENNVHDATDIYYAQNDGYSGGANGIMRDGTTHIDFDLTWPGGKVPATTMIYNDVARCISGSFNGDAGSLPATMAAGTTYTYSFASQSISAWNLSKLRAVLLLIDATSGHATSGQILNSVSTNIGLANGITKNSIVAVHVFPNPTSDMLHIEGLLQNDNISIYDVLGNVVIVTNEKQIDVSGLANGIYFIKTNQGISKFIKQ